GSDPDQHVEQLSEDARKTVKAQLVIDAIGRDAGIDVSQDDLGQEVARQSLRLGRSPEARAAGFSEHENIGALVSDACRRKPNDHLLEHDEVLSAPPEEVLEAAEQRAVAAMQEGEEAATAEDAADDAEDLEPADQAPDDTAASSDTVDDER